MDRKVTNLTPEPVSMDREMPMDRTIKHREFIQGIINRLASDSFRMKGWCVVLVAALFILLAREGRVEFVAAALIPVIAFWGLDGYGKERYGWISKRLANAVGK